MWWGCALPQSLLKSRVFLLFLSNMLLWCAGATEDEQSAILTGPYLRSDVMALRDLHLLLKPATTDADSQDNSSVTAAAPQHVTEQPSSTRPRKTGSKPKWMKL